MTEEAHEPPVLVNGEEMPVQRLDDAAHAALHDPNASAVERGMATVILALIDDRRRR